VSGDIDGERRPPQRDMVGTLSPNNDFEQAHSRRSGNRRSPRANLHLSYFFLPSSGGAVVIATRISGRWAARSVTQPLLAETACRRRRGLVRGAVHCDDRRDFGLILLIGAVGSRGGSFNFGGGITSGGLAPQATSDSLLDQSFFEIVVKLPPGLSLVPEGGYFMRQALIPEPTTSVLLAAGLGLLALAYGRRTRAV
jgi:hypothetical protein